ncbi:unnamed protein product [Linum trigynum]|uniref:RNase H type-1 domain-containing protein n=1 Tax=Linum trigynum TaxID=586398 RepID=A0AAV2FFJ1_9ROSI
MDPSWMPIVAIAEFDLEIVDECPGISLRWRVGGAKVKIWGDKWVPTISKLYVTSPLMGMPVDATVCEFVDPKTEERDVTLIQSCFLDEVVWAITQIPLRGGNKTDKLVWRHSDSGEYVVREAYRVWLESESKAMGISAFGDRETWKSMWAMKVPPKVKHFMWRFMRDALSTRDHVSTRSKKWSDRCSFNDIKETQVNLFEECGWTTRIWRPTTLWVCFESRNGGVCFEWTRQVMQQMGDDVMEEWCTLMWFLWKERNTQLFNGHKNPEYEIASRAHYFLILIDYKEHRLSEEVIREMGEGQYKKNWKRPCQGSISVATEASVIASGGASLGLVLRDDAGRFLAAAAKKFHEEWSVDQAEALAAEMGVQLARQLNYDSIILESNSQNIIRILQNPHTLQTELCVLCRNVRRMLDELMNNSWRFIFRETNNAAHIMAHA